VQALPIVELIAILVLRRPFLDEVDIDCVQHDTPDLAEVTRVPLGERGRAAAAEVLRGLAAVHESVADLGRIHCEPIRGNMG